ncbi:MAG: tRNA lysidine(34) synthetase TilS, partial [Flavipsychrobacter sp.]|nr:tRNA lysidine(34) synthetase TilS [Flavipsychrobacter sp.]
IDTGKYTYSFAIQPKPKVIPADRNTTCLDMKDIQFPILLRKWRTGDYFYPFGMKMKKKKVSRLLVDEKVALHDKEDIRILECSKRIAWVSGIRPDERFRVKDSTENVLVVKRVLNDQ